MQKLRWSDLKTWQKAVLIDLGLTEVGLFAAAWVDLNQRLPEHVNGSKKAWRASLFTGGIGSLAYLIKGRRRSKWTEHDLPNMRGKVAIVTGANSGIGYETARALAEHGATVIMACRNMKKANRAANQIYTLNPTGKTVIMELDLADLDSVRRFADNFKAQYNQLDLLINNAGLKLQPFGTTKHGFESQFGVNHLGHFALTAQLIDLLNHTPDSRIVNVSSIAHRFAQLDFDDLNWQHKPYRDMQAYGQSKLANLLFTYELQRKLSGGEHNTIAVAAHPGYTATDSDSNTDPVLINLMTRLFAQPQPMGALPTLYAATAHEVQGGQYFGPSGLAELGGNPFRVESNAESHDLGTAKRLWAVSEALTETAFPL